MPRRDPLGGREVGEQVVCVGVLQRERAQAPRAIPAQQAREQPHADAAVGVVEDDWALGDRAAANMTETVRAWRDHAPTILPLPHPSWRNSAWLKRNPWFEAELLPVLRAEVRRLA